MKWIELTHGYKCQVSDRDFKWLNSFKWFASIIRKKDGSIYTIYACRSKHEGRHVQQVRMHRLILGVNDPEVDVDHKDNDGLNNQRRNLRLTPNQNTHNSRLREDNTSGFKGVSWYGPTQKWR